MHQLLQMLSGLVLEAYNVFLHAGAYTTGNNFMEGVLVTFDCQFIGRDIPDQNELIENCGRIEGPPPTMRRECIDPARDRVYETCIMLDSQYMYADSSFVQFSEDGIWSGIARLTKFRQAVGSHDGRMLRDQIILTPICIGTPAKSVRISTVQSGKVDPEQHYLQLLRDRQIAIE